MKYLLVIFVAVVVVLAGAYLFFKGLPVIPVYNRNPVSIESAVRVAAPSSSPTATPVLDESGAIISGVKADLIAEHGQSVANVTITISKVEGDYAKGMFSEQGGGGIWFAAKLGGVWKLFWDGNGIIRCTDIAPYPAFPKDLVPDCRDTVTDKLITR